MTRTETLGKRNQFLIEVSHQMHQALVDPSVSESAKTKIRERVSLLDEWMDEIVSEYGKLRDKERNND